MRRMSKTKPAAQSRYEVIVIPPKMQTPDGSAVKRNLRVGAYCRVSTNDEEQATSYEAQIEYYTELIMNNPAWVLADIFADKGLSGTNTKRPDFRRMLRWCRQGKLDLIITKSVSRFARNTEDVLHYCRELKSLGIGVIFEKEGIDTRVDDEQLLTLTAYMAQQESQNMSTNIKWGNQRAFENGRVWYRYQSWYGYREGNDDEPEHVPEELPILQRICKEYLAGATPRMIRDGLNKEGITNRGNPWTVPAIRRILTDEKNCGDVLLQKTYTVDFLTRKVKKNNGDVTQYLVKGRHVAAITREMYDLIQAEAARRAAKKNVSDKAKTELGKYSGKFALTSLLYCGECGSAYRRCTWTSNGQKRIVWRCVSRLDHGKKYCKRSPTIDEGKIHAALLAAMTKVMQDRSYLTEVLREGLETIAIPSDGVQASLAIIQDRLEANELEFDRLIRQMGQVGASDTLEQKAKLLSAERQHLLQAQEEQQGKITKDESISHLSDRICERFLSIPAELTEYDDRLVYQLVAAVKVVSSEKIQITFKNGLEMDQRM